MYMAKASAVMTTAEIDRRFAEDAAGLRWRQDLQHQKDCEVTLVTRIFRRLRQIPKAIFTQQGEQQWQLPGGSTVRWQPLVIYFPPMTIARKLSRLISA